MRPPKIYKYPIYVYIKTVDDHGVHGEMKVRTLPLLHLIVLFALTRSETNLPRVVIYDLARCNDCCSCGVGNEHRGERHFEAHQDSL